MNSRKKELKLVNLIKNYSGLYNDANVEKYIQNIHSELEELKEEVIKGHFDYIEDEMCDVMLQTIMLFEKVKYTYGIKPDRMYRKLLTKYKHRAPHLFQHQKLSFFDENKYWIQAKKTEVKK